MQLAEPRKVVLITGTGHCGSTLLDMMLGGHPSAFGLGELKVLYDDSNYRLGTTPPSVVYRYDDPLWTPDRMQAIHELFARETTWWQRAVLKYRPQLLTGRADIYRTIFAATRDRTVLIDSSKNTRYCRIALAQLAAATDLQPFLIWIWRDPRAVINSYRRKFPATSVDEWIARVQHMQTQKQRLFDGAAAPKRRVSYEALCQNPQAELRPLCALLDLPFREDMVAYWQHEQRQLAGNSGTKTLVARYHERMGSFSHKPWSAAHYKTHPLAIKLDERWRTELPVADQRRIASAFGLSTE